jgi:uncharacterized protein
MYMHGLGVPQNYTEAAKWYRLAAEQGLADAQFIFANMYHEGRGVPQSYTESARWYRLAAEQGVVISQISLGLMYLLGQGVPQDYVRAHLWYNLAASMLPEAERDLRAMAVEGRALAAEVMTPDQIAEAQRLAHKWMEKHGR